jgi:hypothetical protein
VAQNPRAPDMKQIKENYLLWVKFDKYLIFRKENIYTYEKKYKAVKASEKRKRAGYE